MAKKQPIAQEKSSSESNASIFVKGARMHNLKNIDVHFPKNKQIRMLLTRNVLLKDGLKNYNLRY